MNLRRVGALVGRHYFIYRRNSARLFDIVFWPIANLTVWGFVTRYLAQTGSDLPIFVNFLLGALILWEVLVRMGIGVSTSFLEEIWTRNTLNIFASPLTLGEFVVATMVSSLLKVFISLAIMMVASVAFYGFNVLTIGAPFVAFFLNLLIMGWGIGLVTMAIILWFGQSAEIFAWASIAIIQPFSAVFYPVSILPQWLQEIARFVPASHVFEGLRTLLNTHTFDDREFVWALGLNVIYLGVTLWVFFATFRRAKRNGRLVRAWL